MTCNRHDVIKFSDERDIEERGGGRESDFIGVWGEVLIEKDSVFFSRVHCSMVVSCLPLQDLQL